jgi:uncharacterized protein (TIGR03435 family)
MQPGRVTLTNRTLRSLIQFAYSPIERSHILGGADWTDTIRFDVLAKMHSGPNADRANADAARLMLRHLLADRFQLKVASESREMPVYALMLVHEDGRLGPGLRHRPDLDCDAFVPRPGPPPDPAVSGPLCGFFRGGPGVLTHRGVKISALAQSLSSGRVDRPVVDHTQLSGVFDVDLTWAVEPNAANANEPPSIFTAVREQLGLRLNPTRAAVDVIVIEDARLPTPD